MPNLCVDLQGGAAQLPQPHDDVLKAVPAGRGKNLLQIKAHAVITNLNAKAVFIFPCADGNASAHSAFQGPMLDGVFHKGLYGERRNKKVADTNIKNHF